MFELSLVRLDALLLSVQNCQHCTWEKKSQKNIYVIMIVEEEEMYGRL